jgi:hypothetical protein
MRFRAWPVAEGDGTESVTALFLWTPGRRETRRSVDTFFRDSASTLTRLENLGGKTFWVAVMVNDLEELGPTSYFLEALCAFLRENAVAVVGERTHVHRILPDLPRVLGERALPRRGGREH